MTNLEPQVSPGLWALAWRRLRADHVAMFGMVIVLLYLLMLVLSSSGLLAADWADEIGVNYAPPTFVGAQTDAERGVTPAAVEAPPPENPLDPLKDIIRELRASSGTTPGVP